MEDRMCQKRTQEETENSIRELYSEVLQADHEMKQLITELPAFFRSEAVYTERAPENISQQRAVLFLSFAHKVCMLLLRMKSYELIYLVQFYSVHRHFQIRSLKDPWFAYTKARASDTRPKLGNNDL